jgi:hypothetical protein
MLLATADLKATFQLQILGVKKNPQSPMYTQLGVLTKGTVIEVNVSELGMVTAGGKVVFGKYAQVTNNPENDGCINAVLRMFIALANAHLYFFTNYPLQLYDTIFFRVSLATRIFYPFEKVLSRESLMNTHKLVERDVSMKTTVSEGNASARQCPGGVSRPTNRR